jgi:nicotinate dehydrogenase subunit B
VLGREFRYELIARVAPPPRSEADLQAARGAVTGSAGEAAEGPMTAAISNAFAHATGKRLRDLPFSPDRIRAALG